MFNLNTAKPVPVKIKKVKQDEVKVLIKKDYRYIIYLELGLCNKLLLKVYDRIEVRFVYQVQCPMSVGHKHLAYAKRTYRNNILIDKLENSELLFEF